MNASQSTNNTMRSTAILVLALGLASLACNLPYLAGQAGQIEAGIRAELAQTFEQPVQDVRLEGDTLVLVYELPRFQAEETNLVDAVRLMRTGAEQAGRVDWVRVELWQQAAPVLAVTARAQDARLLAEGKLTVEAFLNTLVFEDRRPIEQALQQDLERLGYPMRSVSYQDGVLELSFWQPEIDSTQALVQSWLPVWQIAAQRVPEAGQVVLHAGLLGQPDLRVAAPMELLQAFHSAEVSAAEFLLGLDVQDE